MRSLLGAVRGAVCVRVLASVLGCVVCLHAAAGVAQVTAPVLKQGFSYTLSRPADVTSDVSSVAVVEVLIAADGAVQDARIVELAASAEAADANLRAAVIEHARMLQFQPARRDGVAIPVRIRVRLQLRAAIDAQPSAASGQSTSSRGMRRSDLDAQPSAASGQSTSSGGMRRSDLETQPSAASGQSVSSDGVPLPASAALADQQPQASAAAKAALAQGALLQSAPLGAVAQPMTAAAGVDAAELAAAPEPTVEGRGLPLEAAPEPQRPRAQTLRPKRADAESFGARAKLHVGVGAVKAVAASDMDIEPGALAQVPRLDAQSYMTLSPGVVLSNHSGIGHVSSVFMRGFDAGEGQDLEVRVDDVPINEPSNPHEHGYADPAFVIPETVERLRVQQGAFDPRQGDFAVAGSAAYTLGVKERGLRAQLGLGSFNEQRGLVLWAPASASNGTFTALDLRRGDGFGPERAHQSASLMARYAGASGPLHYSLLLGSHVQQFDSAGVVRQDAVSARELRCPKDERSQFFCVQDPAQGGSGHRQLLRGGLSWARPGRRYELQAYGMLRGVRFRENFTGAAVDARGDGQDEGYKTGTLGMQSSYVLTPIFRGVKQRFELGVSARHDVGETRMWRLRSHTAVPYATVFDRGLALTHIAGYLRAELNPAAWISLRGGVRVDNFGFNTEDLAAPDSDRVGPRLPRDARDAWGSAVSPRAALVLAPSPVFSWSFSAGQGVRSSDAQALSEGERAPFARVLALETGPTFSGRTGPLQLSAHAFAFATRVSDDLLFDPVRGRNIPVGPSNRYGASLSARARIARAHDTLASFTWSDARSIEPSDGILALGRGNALPYVPRSVLRIDHASGGDVQLAGESLRLMLAAGLGWVGPMPMPLGAASYARWQLDVNGRVRWRAYELGASAINLFDVQNRERELYYTSSFGVDGATSMRAARHFAAGAPRSFWLTLTIFLDELELV